MRMSKCCSRWSNLPDDIFDLILKWLGLVDSIRASVVCKSWRCLSDKKKKQQLPLLLSSRNQTKVIRSFYNLFDTSTNCRPTMSPEDIGKRQFCGCSHGWWILSSFGGRGVYLLDPSERRREIQLPLIPKSSSFDERDYSTTPNCFSNAILSCPPVTSAAADCVVIATIYLDCQGWALALCRPGDKEWTFFQNEARFESVFPDMIFFKGKFYVISKTIMAGYKILVCDIGGKNRSPQTNALYDLKEELPTTVVIDGRRIMLYLVEFRGELLLVIRSPHLPRSNMHVFRVDFGTNKLVKVESLGEDGALFLNSYSCKGSSLSSARLFGGKGNCIYYIKEDEDYLGVFDLSNGKHTFFPITLDSSSRCFSHIWVTTDQW